MVVERGGCDESSGRRECNVVDLFLVAEEAGDGFLGGGGGPEVDGEIVRC